MLSPLTPERWYQSRPQRTNIAPTDAGTISPVTVRWGLSQLGLLTSRIISCTTSLVWPVSCFLSTNEFCPQNCHPRLYNHPLVSRNTGFARCCSTNSIFIKSFGPEMQSHGLILLSDKSSSVFYTVTPSCNKQFLSNLKMWYLGIDWKIA